MITTIILAIAIVALAIAISLSARAICRTIAAASRDVANAVREGNARGTRDTRVVTLGIQPHEATVVAPTFDGDASEEILRLHQMRYESEDWRIEASTDDSIDTQDDATAMTEALRRARSAKNG